MKKDAHFLTCRFSTSAVHDGDPITLSVTATKPFAGIYVGISYRLPAEFCPNGFTYDTVERVAYLADSNGLLVQNGGPMDDDPDPSKMTVTLETRDWKPWVYFFRIVLSDSGDELDDALDYTLTWTRPQALDALDARDLSLKVASPADRLDVTVSEPWLMCEGTHARRMCRTSTGVLLHGDTYSEDHGRTWRETTGNSSGWCELRNGKIVGMNKSPQPLEERKGWYESELFESTDSGRSFTSKLSLFHVPLAKPAMGHGPHKGPLYMGSIVERDDGSLVALMAGWFVGDDEICPYGNGRPYSRTYVCESFDDGNEWRYLTTIGYDHLGSEGYNEGTLRRLAGGDFIVVMRTGSMVSQITQDNPIMMSRSSDEGRTWTEPWRTGANGAYPNLLVLSDGMLALSSGRPGAFVMLSSDEGVTWTDRTAVDATPYSGYTSMVEMAPGVILIVFGTKQSIDPRSGVKSDEIRLAEIRYKKQRAVGVVSQ